MSNKAHDHGHAHADRETQIQCEFTPGLAPPPAFASICVVSRFPDYLLMDFGSIDPLMMEPMKGGQKATLQHVGRVVMTDTAARRLLAELKRAYEADAEA